MSSSGKKASLDVTPQTPHFSPTVSLRMGFPFPFLSVTETYCLLPPALPSHVLSPLPMVPF